LFDFDFSVEYRPGRLNTVADALSRRDAEEVVLPSAVAAGAALYVLSGPSFALLDGAATTTTGEGQQRLQHL
jgi:hypothetical protein